MKLSTKGRYGLKAMIDLGIFAKDQKVSIKAIANRQHISENYLEQLIALLKKDGEQIEQFAMTNDVILKLIKKVKLTNKQLISISKNYKQLMKPDQIIKLYED
jgi:bifunctional N-acetylglucosamine-1-phosphate-uridyltransferase/glucosamine-1-phosphate-acetyltransferase GlmU-like protein